MKKEILITGGTGYIGQYLAERILHDHRDTIVNFWIHAQDQSELDRKSERLRGQLLPYQERLKFCGGELAAEEPFATVDWNSITSVIHSAALTNFNVKEADANLVNRDGTVKLLDAATKAPKLEKFTYVSTVYASGLKEGSVPEDFFTNEFGFSNHYERSKWEVEEIIRTKYQHLPWEISRVATIISHDESGLVIQQNAVHNTLKLLYYGLISLMPGVSTTPVYLVTGMEVAEALKHLHLNSPIHQIFNITHDQKASLTLGKLVDIGYEAFNASPDFKAKRILKPLFTNEKAFNSLVESVQGFGGQVLAQAVTSIAPFGKQLYLQKDMQNAHMRKHHPSFTDHDPEQLIKNTCEDLIKKNFKKSQG
jgi:thioester reductase-like protein